MPARERGQPKLAIEVSHHAFRRPPTVRLPRRRFHVGRDGAVPPKTIPSWQSAHQGRRHTKPAEISPPRPPPRPPTRKKPDDGTQRATIRQGHRSTSRCNSHGARGRTAESRKQCSPGGSAGADKLARRWLAKSMRYFDRKGGAQA